MLSQAIDTGKLQQGLSRLRGDRERLPRAAIIVPVNAQADLENVLRLVGDIVLYRGQHSFEVILVVNNYPADAPPAEIAELEALGLIIVGVPNLRRPGEAVAFTARMHGLRAASCELGILFDADCRVVNASALLEWYVEQFAAGAQVAYTHVDYSDLLPDWSIQARVLAHHLSRWGKRTFLGIPTTRGSNYAVLRTNILALYEQGYLADEMNVGPTVKAKGGRVVYSGARELRVLTSGRYLRSGWRELSRYLLYRLRYNVRVLPVRQNVAGRTQRQHTDAFYKLFVDQPANQGDSAQQ